MGVPCRIVHTCLLHPHNMIANLLPHLPHLPKIRKWCGKDVHHIPIYQFTFIYDWIFVLIWVVCQNRNSRCGELSIDSDCHFTEIYCFLCEQCTTYTVNDVTTIWMTCDKGTISNIFWFPVIAVATFLFHIEPTVDKSWLVAYCSSGLYWVISESIERTWKSKTVIRTFLQQVLPDSAVNCLRTSFEYLTELSFQIS